MFVGAADVTFKPDPEVVFSGEPCGLLLHVVDINVGVGNGVHGASCHRFSDVSHLERVGVFNEGLFFAEGVHRTELKDACNFIRGAVFFV